MSIDRKIDYVAQDGAKNYIKDSESVTVPKKFKARKNAPATKLAYITADEAKMLKKMKKGTPHKGPKGIPSYDSFDAQGGFTSGAAMSAAETGSRNQRDRAEVRASNIGAPRGAGPGVKSKAEQDLRSSFLAAGAGQRVNPGLFGNPNRPGVNVRRSGGGIGQLLGSLIGFALGIPGLGLAFSKKGMNFINEKFRGTNPDGSIRTQAEYEQSMYDKRQQNRVAKLLEAKNRGFNQIGFGDFTAKTVDFTPNQQALLDNLIAQGYGPASLDAANPQFQNDLGNPNIDLSGIQTIQQLAQPNINAFPGMGVAPQPRQQQFIEELAPNLVDPVQDQVGNIDNLMAFAPNSKRDRALKNLYSGYENLGIKNPQMIDLMQQDLLENKEKGTPLSLPQSAYTLVG